MKSSTGKPLKPAILGSLFVLSTALAGASHAAGAIEFVSVGKRVSLIQTSATDIQIDPRLPSPSYGGPWAFNADVEGQNISAITAPIISGPISVSEPFFNGGTLLYSAHDGRWELGYPYANNWGGQTVNDLYANFGNGLYTFTVNGATIPLNLTGDAFPNAPIVSLSGGAWSGGKYVIDTSHALTITTNAFTAYGTHADDHIALYNDFFSAEQFHSIVPGSNFLSMTLPAFSLTSGQDYNFYTYFDALVDVNTNPALPGSLNSAYYEVETDFTISAVPEPESYAMMMAGLGLLSFMTRRRKPA